MTNEIKQIKTVLDFLDPDSGNVSASWFDKNGERYEIKNLHEDDYDTIRAALSTIIAMHEGEFDFKITFSGQVQSSEIDGLLITKDRFFNHMKGLTDDTHR